MRKNAKWSMLLTYLIINFVLVLVLAGNASAYNKVWDAGAGVDINLWNAANNWNPDGVPTSTDFLLIDINDANCVIDSTVNAVCNGLDLAKGRPEKVDGYLHPRYLNMSGGTLTVTNPGVLSVGGGGVGEGLYGGSADANGVFTMTGGTLVCGGRLWVGYGHKCTGGDCAHTNPPDPPLPSYGSFSMTTGCDVNVASKIELGKNPDANGVINMYGGKLVVGFIDTSNNDFEIGKYGTGTFNMYGGEVNISDALILWGTGYLTEASDGISTAYLYGGTIYCDELDIGDSNVLMDIKEGTMRIASAETLPTVRNYIRDGKIVGYEGSGTVYAEQYPGSTAIWLRAMPPDPNLATKPSPAKYATVAWTPAGPTLSWTPGTYAAYHDVYFGTDFDDVNTHTDPNTLPGRGRQDDNSIAFPTPLPVLGETYYWRIDEVNDACAPPLNVRKGLTWQFTMADYEEVESFNSYVDTDKLDDVWTVTGSSIDINNTIRRSGNSMKYHYTSTNPTEAYATASTTTAGPNLPVDINDWTKVDIKALVLYFSGDPCNNIAEKMYVALKSTDACLAAVYYDGDANDLKDPNWHEWNIELKDFNDANVNLSSIDKLYIGFDTPVSDGNMYFDDIRLYPRRCRVSLAVPGDIDRDCDVDFDDVNTMVTDWLERDANRVGSDANLMGGATWVEGKYGNGVHLDGISGWVDLDDDDFSNFHNKTIAFWVKMDEFPIVYPYLFYFTDANADKPNPYRIYFQVYISPQIRVRFVDVYSQNANLGTVWRHLAFVLEDTSGGLCNGIFYNNGLLQQVFSKRRHSGMASGVNLGSSDDGGGDFVKATFDDFRVYDYALPQQAIFYLAENFYYWDGETVPDDTKMLLHYDFNEASGTTAANSSTYVYNHPLLSDAELYEGEAQGDRKVNFRDFAVLANNWLEDKLWPW